MPPEGADRAYLWDMLSYARGVVRETADKTWEEYQADENLRLAIERRVEIIGEAANHISEAFRAAHPPDSLAIDRCAAKCAGPRIRRDR